MAQAMPEEDRCEDTRLDMGDGVHMVPRRVMYGAASVCVVLGVCVVGSSATLSHALSSDCNGHGLQPFIDITVPHGASLAEMVAVLYSFVPWVVCGYIMCGAFYKRTSTLLAGMTYVASVVLVNEVLVKRSFPQRRPLASCLSSPGMPSSHSLLAMGLLAWVLLELLERGVKSWNWLFATAILLPVPPARVVLQDHSLEQVTAGSLFGLATALLFYSFIRSRAARSMEMWCAHPFAKRIGIVNDYTPNL